MSVVFRVLSRIPRHALSQSRTPVVVASSIHQCQVNTLLHSRAMNFTRQISPLHNMSASFIQRLGFSSSESAEKEASRNGGEKEKATVEGNDVDGKVKPDEEAKEHSDGEEELSVNDLMKLVTEKDELLQTKQKEIEAMKDKALRSYAEMENVMQRTKREAENSKKFAIQAGYLLH